VTALEKRAPGRPPKYNEDVPGKIKAMMAKGNMTDVQISAALDISRTTLWRWAKEYDDVKTELEIGDTKGESHLTDILYKIGTGEMKGNAMAILAILNKQHGWRGTEGGSGNTYVQNNFNGNVSLTYTQINEDLQKYLDKMGVRNLTELQADIIDVTPEE
jgi:hypothetical protein